MNTEIGTAIHLGISFLLAALVGIRTALLIYAEHSWVVKSKTYRLHHAVYESFALMMLLWLFAADMTKEVTFAFMLLALTLVLSRIVIWLRSSTSTYTGAHVEIHLMLAYCFAEKLLAPTQGILTIRVILICAALHIVGQSIVNLTTWRSRDIHRGDSHWTVQQASLILIGISFPAYYLIKLLE